MVETPSTKRCPFCAETILVAAKKCRYCSEFLRESKVGTAPVQPVSPWAIRNNVESAQPSKPGSILGVVIFLFICVVVGLVALAASGGLSHWMGDSKSSAQVPESTRRTVSLTTACSKSIGDASSLIAAYSARDMDAVDGLVLRGKAMVLKEGTTVDVITRDGSIVAIFIDTGSNIGESCWLPESFLH